MTDQILCITVLVVSAIISYFIARDMDEDRAFIWLTLTFFISMAIFIVLMGDIEYLHRIRTAMQNP